MARPRERGTIAGSMRKWCLSFVLPLLLLLAQQGALRHEIGHLQRQASSEAAGHKRPPGDKLCETCLAYAAMAALAHPAVLPLLLAAVQDAVPTADSVPTLAAAVPAPRSRGPPLSL